MLTAADNRRITALAAERGVHQAFQWLHLHEQQLQRWQLEFLAIPAPPFRETARAQWFVEQFLKLGLHNCHLDSAGNAIAELCAQSADDATPIVLLSAHLDTVFPAGTDCTPTRDAENPAIIRCPGACDNGAGLAALLALAAALKSAEIVPAATILFCANVGEEGEGDLRGMRQLFHQPPFQGRIRAAIALEGGGTTTVVDRALGSRRLRIALSGPGGHSWADAGRPNPILALASALLSIANLQLPSNPRTTLNCGTISGGTSVNSIPASASADLDLRSTSLLELDRIELAVLSTLSHTLAIENRSAPPNMQLQLHVERIGDRPSGYLSPNDPLARSLRAVDRHLRLSTDSHIGSTDANLPLSLGIPALAIGAGGAGTGIHTLQETYDPTGRDLALRRVLLLLLDACSLISG
jgi:acetylornithine deacetylase/succinyl-diaminopimelate desuccinylase-like protein